MSQTVQPYSWIELNSAKMKTEDKMKLLLSVLEGLNSMCEKLDRLNYLIQKKNMEIINIYRDIKENQNENQI
ncbi:MAG: hypothetical protein LBV17_10760 [Treponema sp.]|jgi:hypothetical protein|nr:hypothetical protein [Treponema sp.]